MAARSGKGTLSVALAGPEACAFLGQNAKFKKIGYCLGSLWCI